MSVSSSIELGEPADCPVCRFSERGPRATQIATQLIATKGLISEDKESPEKTSLATILREFRQSWVGITGKVEMTRILLRVNKNIRYLFSSCLRPNVYLMLTNFHEYFLYKCRDRSIQFYSMSLYLQRVGL